MVCNRRTISRAVPSAASSGVISVSIATDKFPAELKAYLGALKRVISSNISISLTLTSSFI